MISLNSDMGDCGEDDENQSASSSEPVDCRGVAEDKLLWIVCAVKFLLDSGMNPQDYAMLIIASDDYDNISKELNYSEEDVLSHLFVQDEVYTLAVVKKESIRDGLSRLGDSLVQGMDSAKALAVLTFGFGLISVFDSRSLMFNLED